MKLNSTTKFLSLAIAMLFSIGVIAQPANDNVCDAIDITNGTHFVESNDGATVEAGEETIIPPSGPCAPGVWCDFSGADGASGIDNSIWFKFDAPADGGVLISGCISDFDNQIAVYEVGDCSDFSTFTYVWGDDDTPGDATCGLPVDGQEYSLSSSFTLECLTPGQTYYIIVDGWQDGDGGAEIVGAIDMAATEVAATGDAAAIESITPTAPTCMGGSDGTAVAVIAGPPPYTFAWSTGDAGTSVSGLSAGDYTFTVTDACGNAAMETITIPDGPEPTQIVAELPGNGVVQPTNCDDGSISSGASGSDGQIRVGVSSGTPPFTMVWNTGDTTAFLNGIGEGTYTVTITDGCGNPAAVESFTLETPDVTGGDPAGPDVQGVCDPNGLPIGGASGLGQLSQLNTTNQADDGNVACGQNGDDGIRYYSENAYLRAFDLDAQFGLSGPVQIEGVDFVLSAVAATDAGGLQPNTYKLYTASSTDLASATLTEIASIEAMVPDMDAEYYRAPLQATVDASEILVVEIFHPGGGAEVGHQFGVGANMDVLDQPTYIRSGACGLSTPTLITDIGFTQQTVMNVIIRDESANTYAWDDPNGGLSATDIAAPVASASGTYTVTVTDLCGNTVVDAVGVDCVVGVVAPEDAVFTISPNPSNGLFQLQNTDTAQNIMLQVFDLQGKMMQAEQFNGTLHTLDLSAYTAGIYVLKLDNGVDIETHKLIVY